MVASSALVMGALTLTGIYIKGQSDRDTDDGYSVDFSALEDSIDDKAQEIIDAEINYSMTDEYYMVERFSDRDPWFVPWSPNASAAGRLILMFLN